MLRRIQFALLALLAAALLSPAQARVGEWKIVGADAISFQNRSATIAIGKVNGWISKIQLRAWGKPVFLRRMTIVYGNGDEHNVRIGEVMDAGGASPIIEVKGRRRYIKEIRLRYRAAGSRGFRRSLIEVYGMEAAPPRPKEQLSGEWRSIVKHRLSTRDRTTTIPINQRMDRIVVRVLDRALDVRRIRIHFGNGDRQTITVNEIMFDGDQIQAVRLKRGLRHVKRVTVELRPRGRRRNARIEILGHGRAPELPPIASGWKLIAQGRIDLQDDRFKFAIGQRKGLFKSLRIRNKDRAVKIRRIRITFGNGSTQTVRLNRTLDGGEQTAVIDLDGNSRFIDNIVVRTVDQRRARRTRLEIIGQVGRKPLPPIPAGWKQLAMERVDLRDDRFDIAIGRNKGLIRRINLRSRDNPVFIRRINIIFGNGDEQRVRIRRRLDPGEEIGVIDLDGNQRFIRKIIVRTRDQNRRRITRLEIIGEKGRRVPRLPDLPGGWKHVGAKTIDLRDNRFVIPIGRDQGLLRAIRLRTKDNAIAIRRVRIEFGNRSTQTIRFRGTVPAGRQTPIIDLDGGKRYIRKIIVNAEGVNRRRTTRLEVVGQKGRREDRGPYGEPSGPFGNPDGGAGNRRWVSFGYQRAEMFVPTVSIYSVGRNKGRFSKLRLRALNHDVKIRGVRVVYGNGETKDFPLRGRIRDGAYSQEVDIAHHGRGRFIQEVVIRHKTKINFRGEGATELLLKR